LKKIKKDGIKKADTMEFNRTKSGYPLDVVKNAIQKYARRGMATKMLEAVSEIDSFKIYDGRINMINRLKVILFEDVSFSQIGAFTTVCEKIKEWEDEGRKRINYGIEKEGFFEKDDFLEFIKDKDISSVEWIYHHEEEALEMLDDYEFPGKKCILPMCKAEWKRLKRKRSNERFSFIVVPWLWIIFADNLRKGDGASAPSFTEKEIAAAYKKHNVQFNDFVYDMEDEIVYNEDSVWLAPYQFIKEWYEEYPGKPAPVAELWVPESLRDKTKPKKAPCKSYQYRNRSTNRCRNRSGRSSRSRSRSRPRPRSRSRSRSRALKPCKSYQYRNKSTNRCRNRSGRSSRSRSRSRSRALKPCKSYQYRSRSTNRCKNR
jgi:hypothetical protein